jgi:hypothetical protein
MPIASDFSIDRTTKNIRHTSGTSTYRVIELHRWLQDVADDASYVGDDELDITDPTPSERSTDNIITLTNGYNIDDDAARYFYDGSIIQNGGNTIYDGLVVLGASGMRLEIIQNGSLVSPNFWTNGINADPANGISHRFLIKVRNAGADIDGRRLIGITREFNFSYSEFKINGTSRGNNVLAMTYVSDLNNQTPAATVATWTDITNTTVGYNGIDVNNDGTDEFFYSEWNRSTRSINDLYERMKYLTRRGETALFYGIQGQLFRGITHEIVVDNPSGTFNAVEPVSWATGTGQMLAINSVTAPTKMWIQLLTGVAPIDNQVITGNTSSATCQVNVTVTERNISTPFCGLSTGSSLIGAYGFGVEALDLSASDKVFDLDNVQYSAPNFQVGTVNGLVPGEDYVLVTNNDGGNIDYDQFTLNGALTGASVTAVVINVSIPADTPNTGTIRIRRANGVYTRHTYTSWSGSTFTIPPTNFSTNNAPNGTNVFISYIDKLASSTSEAFTAVFTTPRSMFIRVRDGGSTPIKPFDTTATFGSGGFSVTVSRISDS